MAKYTAQKTIRIYDDQSGHRFVVEETADPGSITLRWEFGDETYEISDIPAKLATEVSRAINEIAACIEVRDRHPLAAGGVVPATPFNPAILGRNG